jgi:DNA-binding NarL/FixJ family response regulator
MRRVRVLVVDDHQLLQEALVGMLELSGFEVVGAVAYPSKGCSNERLRATLEAAVTVASGNFHRA